MTNIFKNLTPAYSQTTNNLAGYRDFLPRPCHTPDHKVSEAARSDAFLPPPIKHPFKFPPDPLNYETNQCLDAHQ
jgi:hypothetical protein